jgi:hypothetical protein
VGCSAGSVSRWPVEKLLANPPVRESDDEVQNAPHEEVSGAPDYVPDARSHGVSPYCSALRATVLEPVVRSLRINFPAEQFSMPHVIAMLYARFISYQCTFYATSMAHFALLPPPLLLH